MGVAHHLHGGGMPASIFVARSGFLWHSDGRSFLGARCIVAGMWTYPNDRANFLVALGQIESGRARIARIPGGAQLFRFAKVGAALGEQLAQIQLGYVVEHVQAQHERYQAYTTGEAESKAVYLLHCVYGRKWDGWRGGYLPKMR